MTVPTPGGSTTDGTTGRTTAVPGGYAADLAAVRRQLAEHDATANPASPTAVCELLTLRHREIGLSGGRPAQLLTLGAEIDAAITRFPAWPDLRLLRATVALAVHRPDVARAALAAVPELADVPPGRVLTADLAVFDGDYGSARKGYLAAAEEDPLWDTTARLAALTLATGEPVEADRLYAAAEDEITVKQLRSFAWVRVQRAELARAVGNPASAERYLADAERAYPGWWYVLAHRAALELAEGNPEVAVDSYRHVLADVDRPEFREALGTALAAAGEAGQAAGWHHCALAEYLASADRGEVHYLHHLAAYFADVEPDPPAAVAAARADVAVRRNGATLSMLAWCLHRAGRDDAARQAVDEAFALGAGDPLLVARAREIRRTTRGR